MSINPYTNSTESCVDFIPVNNDILYCKSHIDELGTCWNYTKAGEIALSFCPNVAQFNTQAIVKKKCEENGTWFYDSDKGKYWSDYSACVPQKSNEKLVFLYFVGYSFSVICLLTSLIIFFFFKQLRCDRVTLHKNLFSCHLINAIIWIIYYAIISNGDVTENNPAYCQILFIVATYFSVGTYFWMFSEGLYLAVILILTFHKGTKLLIICIITGWGLPFLLTMTYAIVRYLKEHPKECWVNQTRMYLILAIPNMVALGANLIILLFILKMLVTKLRHPSNREETQWSKTAKAVFILIPLLGVQNMIFFISPNDGHVSNIQDYITSLLTSFQGVLVSFILCFFNHEVRSMLKRRTCQHSVLQSLKTKRRGTYTTEITSTTQPRKSIGMRTLSIQSNIV